MKVIGSGFGRTGTLSLKMALEQLGFGPCYHMEEVFKRTTHIQAWHDVAHGKKVNWPDLFEDFQATVDFPASVCYQELLAAFPEAKVIHTVRDPERWYDSTYETIYQASSIFPRWLQKMVKPLGRLIEMQQRLIWQTMLEGSFENRDRAIKIFQQRTEEVKQVVPADRLLIFNVKEGWGPLCHFLDVPVPDTPFPHVNDRQKMLKRFQTVRVVSRLGPVAAGGLVSLGLYGLLSLAG